MKEQLISFETADLAQLKGLRFTLELGSFCTVYNNEGVLLCQEAYEPDFDADNFPDIPAPTQTLLQKWLREKHGILLTILPWRDHACDPNDDYTFRPMLVGVKTFGEFKTWEDALEIGLKEALKLIK